MSKATSRTELSSVKNHIKFQKLEYKLLWHECFDMKLLWYLIISIQYVNDECWNINGIHLKFVYLVKLLINRPCFLIWKTCPLTWPYFLLSKKVQRCFTKNCFALHCYVPVMKILENICQGLLFYSICLTATCNFIK